MDKILGNNGTLVTAMGEITKALNPATQDSFAKAIDTAIKNFPPQNNLDFSTAYKAFKKTIDDSVAIIDEALDKNDLTELDMTNLKAVRSYLTDTLATVDTAIKDSGLDKGAPNKKDDITKEQLEKIQAGLNSAKEIDEAAKIKGAATQKFSQQQAETVSDMRDQLRGFAANPKGSELESANFTSYLETVDAALSNISDQRAKLGASQNRLEYTIKTIML